MKSAQRKYRQVILAPGRIPLQIKDSLEAKVGAGVVGDIKYANEDVRNTGIELEWTRNEMKSVLPHGTDFRASGEAGKEGRRYNRGLA